MYTWESSTGKCYDDNGLLLAFGYAGGDEGHAPEGVNNPYLQDVPNVGPLPSGFYTIGKPYDHPKCGECFLPLTPASDNEMFGRGGFGIHGDLVSAPGQKKASDGCIILPLDVRQKIGSKLAVDHDLRVIAHLPEFAADVDGEIAV